jgi:MFS family permease
MPQQAEPEVHDYGHSRVFHTPSNNIFYGWWIVLAGIAIFIVSSGIGFYGHGVFLDPLRAEHGWSKGSISLAVTLYFITTGILGLFIGRQVDRFGPRPIMIIGALIAGLGFGLLSLVQELWQLYLVYLFIAIGWSASSMIPINTVITHWFIRRRGLAMSLVMNGLSLGGIILVPCATYLIAHWGLKVTLPILGGLFWVVIIPLAVLVIKRRPSDIGQFPDGWPLEDQEGESGSSINYAAQVRIWTRREAMGTTTFWAIVGSFLAAMTAQTAYLMHQISFLSQTLGVAGAASAVSLTAGASIAGRLALGTLVDRIDKRYATMGLLFFQAAAVLSLAFSTHAAVLYLGTFAFGLTMGGILMMQSLITGECFGMVSFATISGALGLFIASGSALGPAIAGFIFDATQSYQIAFAIFAAISLLGSVLVLFAKPPAGNACSHI